MAAKAPVSLTTHAARQRLPRREAPYYMELTEGNFLGYRCLADSWCARHRDRHGKQHHKKFGKLPEYEAAKKYEAAKRQAETWFEQMGGVAARDIKRGTVRNALDTYLKHLRMHDRGAAAATAEGKFETCIYDDPIASMLLENTTRDDWQEWRARLKLERRLANQSVNRYVGAVTPALNCAVENGHTGNPLAWKLADLSVEQQGTGEAEAAVFITDVQADRLFKNASPAARDFFEGMDKSGARPQELAAAKVRDYNADAHTLVLRHFKGRPAKLRARVVSLDKKDAPAFRRMIAGKMPDAPLFADDKGRHWTSHRWAAEFRAAAFLANGNATPQQFIPMENRKRGERGASAYSIRHRRISIMLQRMDINIGVVAEQTGTSVAMIEKYYFKFLSAELQAKFDRAAA